ncbi:MAG: hypothetical protein IM574_12060 [Cytophagales bacterium]|jgi:hypothetical protein|nr:hypothetical protein [Cytophagales bacterium]MCA6386622.1 hypothetical protein [Cytophagales bacterium]MCA6389868.1 hypothetical protein [Cytophagales bacterium]MCA6396719.1 hypothetical protein [Cytophagales bacterium]MCA6398622.1 hypothetical protein [Cytophagales bacterium]
MRKLCFALLSVLFLVGLSFDSFAQFNRKLIKKNNKAVSKYRGKKRGFGRKNVYTGVGFSINALNYFGDLAPTPSTFSTDISFTAPSFGLSLFHRFGPRYTLQVQYLYASLKGSDQESASKDNENKFRYQRNMSFRNRIHELSAVAYFDLFENQATYISRVGWTPYAYIGLAAFYQNPQAQAPTNDLRGSALAEAGQWVDLQPLKTEGNSYSLIQFAVPFGAGARFRINEVFDLWADIGFRYTFTDYLDDVSGNYVDLNTLSTLGQAMAYRTNELAGYPTSGGVPSDLAGVNVQPGYGKAGDKRGSPNQNDIYMVTSIRLTYILGATFHKAKFR